MDEMIAGRRIIRAVLAVAAMVALAPIIAFEFVYRYELASLGELPSAQGTSASPIALDATWVASAGDDTTLSTLWLGNYFDDFIHRRSPQPSARWAADWAARLYVSEHPVIGDRIHRNLVTAALAVWFSRHSSADDLKRDLASWQYYGRHAVGLERAAQAWFGRDARQLTLAQAAFLAGLPQSPNNLDPLQHPQAAKQRRDFILGQLRTAGVISATEENSAASEPITAGILPSP